MWYTLAVVQASVSAVKSAVAAYKNFLRYMDPLHPWLPDSRPFLSLAFSVTCVSY